MIFRFFKFNLILYTFFLLGISNLSYSKTPEFNFDAKNISNYFSGLVSFDDFDYFNSKKFFKTLDNLEPNNMDYASKFIQSLINLGKYKEAYSYSKKLEKKGLYNFESNLFLGLYSFKEEEYEKSQLYFNKLKPNFENQVIFDILKDTIDTWLIITRSKYREDENIIDTLELNSTNLKMIQQTFGYCYLNKRETNLKFKKIVENNKSNFSRYNFFFANYLYNNEDKVEAKKIVNLASKKYPRNLLINQLKQNLNGKGENKNKFNCKNSTNVMAEIFYVLANALSTQNLFQPSNFYINLAKFLNPNFPSYNSLLAENFIELNKNVEAEKIYKKLSQIGTIYRWHSSKQITVIMENNGNKNSLNFLSNIYKNINPGIYETYDFANFLRNKENYEESIKLYSEILEKIDKDHNLYSKVLERRGTAYERNDNWELAEKDLLASLEILPDEPYVMNYLAYSWVEKNKNIEMALDMLKRANNIKKNDGYITDSLGWALYKLKDFEQAKKYLEMAIILMPRDPVINDHFADCLWMNNHKLQARYYWNNVLKSETADEELKIKVEKKILFGLQNI